MHPRDLGNLPTGMNGFARLNDPWTPPIEAKRPAMGKDVAVYPATPGEPLGSPESDPFRTNGLTVS